MRDRFLDGVRRVAAGGGQRDSLRDWRAGETPVAAADRSPTAERRCADGGPAHRRGARRRAARYASLRRVGPPGAHPGRTNGRCAAGGRSAAAHAARQCVSDLSRPTRWGRAAHRLDAGDARAARPDRAAGRDRLHRAHRGRVGNGKGTGRTPDPRPEPPARRPLCGHQLRGVGRVVCWKPSCSASRSARRLACADGAASSSTPIRARCSSTKCRTCRCPHRPSCFEPSRSSPSNASAARGRSGSTSGSWRRPIAACDRWWPTARSGPTCSTGSAASSCRCRLCAIARPTSSSSRSISWSGIERHGA